jgi:DNA-directed RNA polymerase subunit beta
MKKTATAKKASPVLSPAAIVDTFTGRKRIRRSFGKIREVAAMPNLIEVQKDSYEQFLQMNVPAEERKMQGLQEVLSSVFPIKDFSDKAEIDFVKYELEDPKYDVDECYARGMTFAAPLRVTLRLSVFDVDEETGLRSIRDIKEQDVYMVDMPLMTRNGTFIVNGTERVIVSQMHRSPGVFFDHDGGKTHASGKYLFAARIIPYRGSWLDFEFDAKDILNVRIDRRRKLPVTTFLRALYGTETEDYILECQKKDKAIDPLLVQGMSNEEILSTFYKIIHYTHDKKGWKTSFDADRLRGVKLVYDLVDAKSGKVVSDAGTKMTPRLARKLMDDGLKDVLVQVEELVGSYLATDVLDPKTGLVLFEAGHELAGDDVEKILEEGGSDLPILAIDHINVGPYLRTTMLADKCDTREEALIDIYRVMRPGEPPTVESAEGLFHSLFFDPERYDLSAVGRVKMNAGLISRRTINCAFCAKKIFSRS